MDRNCWTILHFCLLILLTNLAKGQLTGNKTIPGNYASVALAIADLNALGVGMGGVTFDIAAGYTESNVSVLLSATPSPPNAERPIVFRKVGAGANPLLTAGVGISATVDGIVVLNGVDYVTFDGIDLQENPANATATTQMEWGYALVKTSVTNGCQHNTIKNCTVTLNKSNLASRGIYSGNHTASATTAMALTTFSGTSSYNRFYNNTVQNCFHGISLNGFSNPSPFDLFDQGNEIGVDGVSSRRNQILNFGGGATGTANGISLLGQNQVKVFNTYINNAGGAATSTTLNGISSTFADNSNQSFYNDTISLSSAATTANLTGIYYGAGNNGLGNRVEIYNCDVSNFSYANATTGICKGIQVITTTRDVEIHHNTVQNHNTAGTGLWSGIHYGGGSGTSLLVDIHHNEVSGNIKTGTAGLASGIYFESQASDIEIHDNLIHDNAATASSGGIYGYYNANTGGTEHVYNNQVYNLNGGSGTTVGLYASCGSAPTDKDVHDNLVHDLQSTGTVGGIFMDRGTRSHCRNNRVWSLTSNAANLTPSVYGISFGNYITSNLITGIHNNFISGLKAPVSTSTGAIYGLWIQGTGGSEYTIANNTVYLDASSTSTTSFGTAAAYLASLPISIDLRNNILVNQSTPGPTSGNTVALARNTTSVTNLHPSTGFNCYYAGVAATNRLLYHDGTTGDMTIQALKLRMGARDQGSISELPPFVNTAVAPYNLHLQAGSPTGCAQGGLAVAGLLTDYDGDVRNTNFPTIGADETAVVVIDNASPDIQYTLLSSGGVFTTRLLPNFATIIDPSGINVANGTKPRIYYKKSTQANAYVDNTAATNGWKYVEASNASSPFTFTIDHSLMFGGTSVAAGDVIQYFVVAQDLNAIPRVGINKGGFATPPTSVALGAAQFPLSGTPAQYAILANSYSGTISVGPGQTFTSLTNAGGAFASLNVGVLTGNVTLSITGDLLAETGTVPLNQLPEHGGTGFGISIVPSAPVIRTIAGSHATLSLVRLDGADHVKMDGRFNGSGKYLRIRNTSNTAPSWGLINDCHHDTLSNCIIESGNTMSTLAAAGAVHIGSTNGPEGNDDILIDGNDVRDRSDIVAGPLNGIYCEGNGTTPRQRNHRITISNNNIYDWYVLNGDQHGIFIQNGNAEVVISGNSIYQTVPRSHTHFSSATYCIRVQNGVGTRQDPDAIIRNNFIGGTAPGATGGNLTMNSTASHEFAGILALINTYGCTIENNVIRNVNLNCASPTASIPLFEAIHAENAHFTIHGNTLGDTTANGNMTVNLSPGGNVTSTIRGIYVETGFESSIQDNAISGFTVGGTSITGGVALEGISFGNYVFTETSIVRNLIGSSTTANSFYQSLVIPKGTTYGIRLNFDGGIPITIDRNRILNLTDLSTSPTAALYGINYTNVASKPLLSVTNNQIQGLRASSLATTAAPNLVGIALVKFGHQIQAISGNTIADLSLVNSGNGAGNVMGIYCQGHNMSGTVAKNTVYNLNNANTGATALIAGMYFTGSNGWSLQNNVISLRNDSATNNMTILGIAEYGTGDFEALYNTVYIGDSTSGTAPAYAYFRGGYSQLYLRNNLFYNGRIVAGGNSFAIGNQSSTPSIGWLTTSASYNTYVSRSSTRLVEWGPGNPLSFAQWKQTSGGDIESYADTLANVPADSLFLDPVAADLRIDPTKRYCWYVNGKGIAGAASGSIATDNWGTVRGTTLGIPTDIGAMEFTPAVGVNPIPALASGPPSPGATTSYSFAGRRLGDITWGSAGTLPSWVRWTYYSSVPPPGALVANNIQSYWELVDSGGLGYTYDLNNYYTIHEQNQLADGLLKEGRQFGASPWYYLVGSAQSNSNGKYLQKTGLSSFTNFTLGLAPTSPDYTIVASVIGGLGSVSPVGTVTVAPLNDQLFTFSPAPCYSVDSVFVNGIYVGGMSSYLFSHVDTNYTLQVKFKNTPPIPSVAILANPGTTICAGTNVTFTASSTNAGTLPIYEWYLNGILVGANSPTYSNVALADSDVVTCILRNTDCIPETRDTSNADTITVFPGLAATVNADSSACGYNIGCNGGNDGTVHALGTGGCMGYTYLWNTGDTTATVTGLGAGTYTVTVSDGTGGLYMDSVTLTAPPLLVASVGSVGNTCPGDSTGSASVIALGGSTCQAYTYLWSNGATSSSLTGLVAGNYDVTVTDAQGCTATRSITVTNFAAPSPSFTQAGNTLTATQSWSSYQWLLNGLPIVGADSISYVLSTSGTYALQVTDSNGCLGISAPVVIVGMEAHMQWALQVLPNPARGEFRLRTAQPIGLALQVNLSDLYGKQLLSKDLPRLDYEEAFDISNLAAGSYNVEVIDATGERKIFRLHVQ